MFQADDGQLFVKKMDAQAHEELTNLVKKLKKAVLPAKFDDCDFANGSGFIQLSQRDVTTLTNEFLTAIETYHKSWFSKAKANPKGFIGRYLCDSNSPLYETYSLLNQIDSANRLWGQPYYASNPNDGKQVQLNK